jgi:hypothetical protein
MKLFVMLFSFSTLSFASQVIYLNDVALHDPVKAMKSLTEQCKKEMDERGYLRFTLDVAKLDKKYGYNPDGRRYLIEGFCTLSN